MNIFDLGLMLKLVATACGYKAGTMTHFLGNVHFYDNQYEQAEIQLKREPKDLPELIINKQHNNFTVDGAIAFLETIEPSDITLNGYNPHDALERVEMAQEKA